MFLSFEPLVRFTLLCTNVKHNELIEVSSRSRLNIVWLRPINKLNNSDYLSNKRTPFPCSVSITSCDSSSLGSHLHVKNQLFPSIEIWGETWLPSFTKASVLFNICLKFYFNLFTRKLCRRSDHQDNGGERTAAFHHWGGQGRSVFEDKFTSECMRKCPCSILCSQSCLSKQNFQIRSIISYHWLR